VAGGTIAVRSRVVEGRIHREGRPGTPRYGGSDDTPTDPGSDDTPTDPGSDDTRTEDLLSG
jgi:hypothetical protein